MNTYLLYIIVAFAFSLIFGFVSIPYIIDYCVKHRLYDQPGKRKVHTNNIPRLGGICFLPSMTLALIISVMMFNNISINHQVTVSLWSVGFFVSLTLIYAVGIMDDIIGLNAPIKFFAQIAAASLFPLSGLYLNNLYGFLGIHEIPYWIGAPITIFIIVFINNAMNLIDGIDGLSGSLATIALAGFLYLFYSNGIWVYSIIIAGLMGVIIAFLFFNLFGDPKKNHKVFMGDSGSLTIGFILGFLAIKCSMNRPDLALFNDDAMLVAYTLIIVPCFDVIRVSALRFMRHRSVFRADKNHIHHKLLRTGMNQHQALLSLIALALLFVMLNMVLSMVLDVDVNIIVCADIIVWLLFQQIVNRGIRRNNQKVFHVEE